MPSSGSTATTRGSPSVRVPVLSKTTVSTRLRASRAPADLHRMPSRAPLPVPTIMAIGVASPRTQGQEITSTAIALARAKENPSPAAIHPTSDTRATAMTAGTKK